MFPKKVTVMDCQVTYSWFPEMRLWTGIATVQLPAKFNVAPQADAKGIHAVTHADGHTTIELGSGNYTLSSK